MSSSAFFEPQHFTLQHSATFPMMSGPPPPVAPINPQYADPSSASLQSLQRTIAAASAAADAAQQHDFHAAYMNQSESLLPFNNHVLNATYHGDRAQFPSVEGQMVHLDGGDSYSYGGPNVPNALYSASNQSMPELRASPAVTHTPTAFTTYSDPSASDNISGPQVMSTFPSQLLPTRSHDGLPKISRSDDDENTEERHTHTVDSIGFTYDVTELNGSSSTPPPAPPSTIPFKSPPPMDIASRRKKVHVKPAALTADTLKSRPSMGPRTVSHADGFRRTSDSPIGSPMRRIASAGGSRNVFSGRVNKSGVESAQRSPINLGGFAEPGAFLDHNYHNIRQPPSLTAGSSLNSSLAPPTPMSPRGGEMTLVKRDNTGSNTSSADGGMNFVFNTGVPGCFSSVEGGQNLASPPETPQNPIQLQQSIASGWPAGPDYDDKQWAYDVPDEPLYTPAHDSFQQLELQMPQPSYLNSASQPVTPAFGQFNQHFIFGNDSPQYKNESPYSEYSFPEPFAQYAGGMASVSPQTKQKTFQFSNTTPADFTDK
jgi:hypothetical protein